MRSLRAQITLSMMLLVVITVFLASALSNALVKRRFETYVAVQRDAKIANIVDNLSLQYDAAADSWNVGAVYALGMSWLYDGYIIKVADESGAVVWDAESHDRTRCRQVMDEITRRMEEYGAKGGFVPRERPLTQGLRRIGSVSINFYSPIFFSESDVIFLGALNLLLAGIGAATLLLSLVTGAVLARRIARPIASTAAIARHIARGNYQIRFEGQAGTLELSDLVSSLNHLSSALERQEGIRKRMTADVAHELRTPLTTLGSHLEMMIEGVWQPTPERLKSCHDEILRLTKLVADLERLEKAESGDPRLEKAEVELLSFTKGVCLNFEGELAHKNLSLSIEGGACVIWADPDSVSSVIKNLMSNAVKYTGPGGHIRVSVRDEGENCAFCVTDDGPGIPPDELPSIFERFYRADKSRNRNTGGSGIGLAIVKSLVQAHGGHVTAENLPERGIRFTVTLPKG